MLASVTKVQTGQAHPDPSVSDGTKRCRHHYDYLKKETDSLASDGDGGRGGDLELTVDATFF